MVKFICKLLTFWLPVPRRTRKSLRSRLLSWFRARMIGSGVKVGKSVRFYYPSHFTSGSEIGDWCMINGVRVVGKGKVRVGKHTGIAWDVLIHTSSHNYEGDWLPFALEDNMIKDVEIGDFVWVGSNVVILPGTKIGEGAIIQGGSVVHGEIPPLAIAGGNPAKVFKMRDAERFARLKAEGRYYKHSQGSWWGN